VSGSLQNSTAAVALNVDIIAALTHERLWRKWLGDDIRTWAAWFCFLRSLFGLKLTAAERRIFKVHGARRAKARRLSFCHTYLWAPRGKEPDPSFYRCLPGGVQEVAGRRR
jgi:hypothetical protein